MHQGSYPDLLRRDLSKLNKRNATLNARTQNGYFVLKVLSLISSAPPVTIAASNCSDPSETDPSFLINPEIPEVLATRKAR
jgi:hypothetical protein